MKLLRVAVENEYNALAAFDQQFVFVESRKKVVDPVCLVGENGSGKSNFLEIIVELFYHVELDLRLISNDEKPSLKVPNKIEVEYIQFKGKKEIKIQITSYDQNIWKMKQWINGEFIEIPLTEFTKIRDFLPSRIIGYSSGNNESLSFWFTELNKRYSKEVQDAADNEVEGIAQGKVVDPRLLYIDFESNSSLVVANYLYNSPNDLKIFNETLRISDVESFRIEMDFKLGSNSYVRLSEEHKDYIRRLRYCSTSHNITYDDVLFPKSKLTSNQEVKCTFDFFVNSATRRAIRKNFSSAYELFMAFQKFELLNNLKLSGSYTKSRKRKELFHRQPTVGFEDKIFKFDDIRLRLSKPNISIPYIGISDGEHQFLQTVGTLLLFNQANTLFLLDEPETHLNPQWRRNYVNILHTKTKNRFQEIVMTTHSPFIVSDCRGYNVFLFKRIQDKVKFERFAIETYGTSTETILKEAFGMDENISRMAHEDIKKILRSKNYDAAKKLLNDLGSSYEKMEASIHVKSLEKKKK